MAGGDSGRVESNVRFGIGLLLLIAVLLGAGHWVWLKVFLMNAETAVGRLARTIGPAIGRGGAIDEGVYRNFIAAEPRTGYVVFADYRSGYRHGLTNLASLRNSASGLGDLIKKLGTDGTLTRLIQPGGGFAGEYLHVVSASFVPSKEATDVTPLGVLKIGFVVPGYVAGLPPFGRGFSKVILVWWAVTGVVCAVLLIHGMTRGNAAPAPPPFSSRTEETEARNELSWLEKELEKEETFFVDHEGQSWKVLFDGATLDPWKLKGQIYISEGEVILRPWGASAVHPTAPSDRNFAFRVYARKIAGLDGFVILFPCDNRFLTWVMGGWRNRRFEVAGYGTTARNGRVEKNRWYQLDVRLGPDWVEGFIDNVPSWKIARSEIRSSSPDVGFQQGLGVAVWNTLVRFRDFRYRAL